MDLRNLQGRALQQTEAFEWFTGEYFQATIETSRGPVDALGQINDGNSLTLEDVAISGRDAEPMTGLTREMLAARTQLAGVARSLGLKELRITRHRTLQSTPANPGKTVDITVDLTKS